MRALLACLLCLLPVCAAAQRPLPARLACSSAATVLTDPKYPGYPTALETFDAVLKKAVPVCTQAVQENPGDELSTASAATVLVFASDLEGAVAQARVAASKESRDGLNLLGVLQVQGHGLPRDPGAGAELIRKAWRKGSPLATYNLGVLYAEGIGVPKDAAEAFKYYHGAANERDLPAMLRVAQCYAEGRGVAADREKADAWWRKAAEQFDIEVRDHPGRLRERTDIDSARLVAWLTAKANAGEPWAQAFLGRLHEYGKFMDRNLAVAMNWYRKAAEQDYPLAEGALGHMYAIGSGVPVDRDESLRWSYRWWGRLCEKERTAPAGTNECDRLAGDRYDPQRATPGVSSMCLAFVAESAVTACRAAVRASPSTVRFRAQLARALGHAGQFAEARREATTAANSGSTMAMVLLGALEQAGTAKPLSETRPAALAWYRRAAASGQNEQALRLAQSMEEPNSEQARDLQAKLMKLSEERLAATPQGSYQDQLRAKAEAGDAEAQFNLAASHETFGPKPNYEEAFKWYMKAAAQGHAGAQYSLAWMYKGGFGVKADPEEAIRLYRMGAETGGTQPRWELAKMLRDKGDYAGARIQLDRLVLSDDLRAIVELGQWYEGGVGVALDMKEAVRWYDRAVSRSPWAKFRLAAIYTEGKGVPRNDALAFKYWRELAESNRDARNNLGVMYASGRGVAKNEATAMALFLEAAKMGSYHAIGNLQPMYEADTGRPADAKDALAYYRKGADVGVPSAQYKLGMLYLKDGPTQDYRQALDWLTRAGSNGDKRAFEAVADMYEQGLGVEKNAQMARLYRAAAAKDVPQWAGPPPGFVFGAGVDQSRQVAIRSAGSGVAAAARGDMSWSVVLSKPMYTPRERSR
ncbi:tetratricopeptide repeat protein [Usitatibacter palustris]|uniref:tetratricopeptide repeat protein n=1 Tax=Usitatibacter palustris TaxID=2732487 RepID=UPI001487EEAE|nr:tetratricopeptide repeat protein [Usitatibacter palustris]